MEANPDAQDLAQQLAAAARDGDDDATRDLGDPYGAGRSAVHWAAMKGHVSTVRLLESKGADVHAAADLLQRQVPRIRNFRVFFGSGRH